MQVMKELSALRLRQFAGEMHFGIKAGLATLCRDSRRRFHVTACLTFVALFLAAALLPSSAAAAECTDTWSGAAEGAWATATNWSAKHVPTETDVACIGSGKTVNITEGSNKITRLSDEGTLRITGGSLEITGTSEASTASKVVLKNATLTGAATLNISKELAWEEHGAMTGNGKTVILNSATSSLKLHTSLAVRTLINEGTLTAPKASELEMAEGAILENKGKLLANAEEESKGSAIFAGTGAAPLLVNKGTIEKSTSNSPKFETKIGVSIENFGKVDFTAASSGKLAFLGNVTSSGGTWGKNIALRSGTFSSTNDNVTGTLTVAGATGSAKELTGSSGTLQITSGSVSVPAESTDAIGTLKLEGGKLDGSGSFKVTTGLTWNSYGTMSGSGTTTLTASATGEVTDGVINERHLVNAGTLTASHFGEVEMAGGAVLENTGTFRANAQEEGKGAAIFAGSGAAPVFINKGTVEKSQSFSPGYETKIGVPVENYGRLEVAPAVSGTLSLLGGGSSSSGTWGKNMVLKSGSFQLLNDNITGTVTVSGGSVTATGITGSEGTLQVKSGSLTTPTASEDAVSKFKLEGGTLTGSGTLKIGSELIWNGGAGMTGSGKTVVQSAATGEIKSSVLSERTLYNEGKLTQPIGTTGVLEVGEGAQIENLGEYFVNGEAETPAIQKGAGAPGLFINRGTLEKTKSAFPKFATKINVKVDNTGTVATNVPETGGNLEFLNGGESKSGSWKNVRFVSGSFSLIKDTIAGRLTIVGPSITAEGISGSGPLQVSSGSVSVPASTVDSIQQLKLEGGTLTGAGDFTVTGEMTWGSNSEMSGSGTTTLQSGASGEIEHAVLAERHLVNNGTLTATHFSELEMAQGAVLENKARFLANGEQEVKGPSIRPGKGAAPKFINKAQVEKTTAFAPNYESNISVNFENYGGIAEKTGTLSILSPVSTKNRKRQPHCGDPVNCATGDYSESQADFLIGGRGVGLDLVRSYSAESAATSSGPGAFGYGWTSSFSDHLTLTEGGKTIILTGADDSIVPFAETASEVYTAPIWSQDVLEGNTEKGYVLTLVSQTSYRFSGGGQLESVTDRNGNKTSLAYNEAGRLETITDPVGRHITFAYNGEGFVKSAEDPLGHVVKYAYESENLSAVTLPGSAEPSWQFKYDALHRIVSATDGRGGKTSNEYDSSNRVISQTDPAGRTLTFKYKSFHSTITNKATGAVTDEWFTSNNEPLSITRGYGTAAATTESFTYNEGGQLTNSTDGGGRVTTYGYNSAGDKTSEKNTAGEAKWTYNTTHDIVSMTTPGGETTTIKRDANGNVESISRPGPKETMQTTTFSYGEHGQLESVTDPLKNTWAYGYDAQGDRISETDPLGDTLTMAYDKDSRLVSRVSPRGNVEGAKPSEYEVAIERDAQGRQLKVTDPLGHATEYSYDANGNLKSETDAKGNTTKYVYDADNEQTEVVKPTGAVLKTAYNGAGAVTSQTDGNKHATTYVRNVLGEPTEVVDPLGRKTKEEFDAAGNLKAVIDPAERKTIFGYDGANRLTEVNYSEEATPDVKFEYDADGNMTGMVDGSGASSFSYDQLDRLTRTEDGHGDVVGYGYDLSENLTGITYPNGKSITRSFDPAGQLESVTDWLGGTTSFSYDPNSNLTGINYPVGINDADSYAYDRADRMSEAIFKQGAETLGAATYTRGKVGDVEGEARSGLPGVAEESYGYDPNGRLTSAGEASFEYDSADNLIKGLGSTNTYDAANQLATGTGVTYTYNSLGERTKTAPSGKPATTFGYDQADNLISISRPEEGELPKLSESMSYSGTGLIASKTTAGTTHYFTWGSTNTLPILLDDGENSYIYGPGGLPLEQVSSEGAVLFLHHDQIGSSRLLTDATGEVAASSSFSPYGSLEASTGSASTPMGFAGQYTDQLAGLQYLRARFYDPSTAQFLTRDPLRAETHTAYSYAYSNPLRFVDPSGLGPCILGFIACDESDDPCKSLTTGPMLLACLIPEEDGKTVSNATAGFGDGASFGLTKLAREGLGQSGNVETCTLLYEFSSEFGGAFRDFTLTVAGAPALREYPIRIEPQVPRDLPPRYQLPPRDLDP